MAKTYVTVKIEEKLAEELKSKKDEYNAESINQIIRILMGDVKKNGK